MFVRFLCFDWRDVSKWLNQALFVEPIDPLQGFPFDLIFGFPRPQTVDDLSFEQPGDCLGQRVVITVSDTANGWFQSRVCQPFSVFDLLIVTEN